MYRTLPIIALVLVTCAGPSITFASDTPADLRDLGRSVFSDFVQAFPARAHCIGKVEVTGVHDMADRARYHPSRREIELRIPATAPQLTASLLHELGHHLEHSCPEQAGARPRFLEALGLHPDSAWFDPSVYETNPSELWAEAVVRHVSGKPDTRRPLDAPQGSVTVVKRWGEGEFTHSAATP